MKKIICFLVLVFIGLASWLLFANRLDYNKIVIVLPSSKLVSSPFFYKKDGDFFLANDLKAGFENLGYEVEYRFREDYNDIKLGDAGNVIYLKGYYNFEKLPKDDVKGRKNILYIYYVEGLHLNILDEVDVVVSGSKRLIDESLKPLGKITYYVPQFTNPERFKPYEKTDKFVHEVLFVGSDNSNKGRECVNFAVDTGAKFDVYGKFWDGKLPAGVLKGGYIDNDELYKHYSNAKIVLNDHRRDMKYFGFISNRIYDVTASGGFILSDYMPEIEEVYGDSIVMYKNYDEFKQKIDYYLSHEDEREELIEKARKITLENFTNVKVAQIFDNIFKNIKK